MIETSSKKNRIYKGIGFSIFIVLIELLFFRNIIGNDNLIGNNGDARYIDLILEHYYQWLNGTEKFTDLRCFYPVTNTISYSDMLLGLAIPFCIFRKIGLSMFWANKLGLILIHCIGTVSTVYLFDKKIKLSPFAVMVGTTVFCYANSLSVKSWHNQMLAVCFVPLMLIFLYVFFENIKKRNVKRVLSGIGAILIMALLFYTSFYNAYFLLIFGFMFLVSYIVSLCIRKVHIWRNIGGFIKSNPIEFMGYIIFGIAIMIPFLIIYLPTFESSGSWDWDVVESMLPTWRDFFNVSPDNIVYGAFFDGSFFKLEGFYAGELRTGFPLVTLTMFFVGLAFMRSFAKKECPKLKGETSPKADYYVKLLYPALGIGVLLCFILMVKVHDKSLWSIVYRVLPGIGGIRAVSRFNMFLTLPVAIVIAGAVDRVLPMIKAPKIKKIVICTLLLCFIFAENTLSIGVKSLWNVSDAEALTSSVSAPPSDCSTFYVLDSDKSFATNDKDYQLVAWEIAYKYDINVINGHSGQFPPDWSYRMSPHHDAKAYSDSIDEWIEKYKLENVYSYDLSTDKWTAYIK